MEKDEMSGIRYNTEVEMDEYENSHRFYRYYGKRFLDVFLSVLALIFLSPLLLLLSVLVLIMHGSPILFSPTRPGMNERIFHICKFRSMSNAKNSEGKLLPEKDRLTKLGKFLRASSLDELPELINIIRGDMSIVGPRPLSKGYLISYTKAQRIRHSVRPGLTGLAQISGRNNLSWDKRTEIDLEYVRNLSFKLDCSIVLRTIIKVLKREDVTIPGGKQLDLAAFNLIEEEGENVHMKGDTSWPEIGSNFWLEKTDYDMAVHNTIWFPEDEDGTLTFSGRSAIALALRDAMKNREIKRAYVPSYCCLSMLQAFIDLNIPYDFYEVEFDGNEIKYHLDTEEKYGVLLIMKYFGVNVQEYDEYIHRMKQKGCIVIEDVTHTLFDVKPGNNEADYHVASLRKWVPSPAGGYLSKSKGLLALKPEKDSNHAVEKVLKAMNEKREYITGNGGKKANYLKDFSSFNQDLIQLDVMLKLDDVSCKIISSYDYDVMKCKRKANAEILYRRLKNINGLSFLDSGVDFEKKTPLFVPIILPELKRDELRQFLIDNGVYCPVHWPETIGAEPGIRKNELSLICDQRYAKKDMNAVADLIIMWCDLNITQ